MKKNLFTSCLCLLANLLLNSQTNTFPTSGNAGIGTINPSSILHIKSSQDNILTFQTSDTSWLYTNWLDNTNTRRLWMGLGVDLSSFNISVENGTNKILLNGGNVGIGTTDPSNLQGWNKVLDVHGTNHSKIIATTYTSSVITGIFSHGSNWNGIVGRIGTESNHDLRLMAGYGLDQVTIKTSGNVGIGTTAPDSKLTVKGNIHTNEVKVDLLGAVAPDYVFYKDYDLKSLKAVEDYIAAEGHLPNIPSAKDMVTDGILLKEMNLKLLEKIEELTLYAIEQEKRMDTLESENKILKTQEERITELEEKLTFLLNKN